MASINNTSPPRKPDVARTSEYHTEAFTLSNGCPIDNPFNSDKVVQKNGNALYMSQLLQDLQLIDQLSHFNRERIPERLGHAKGTGAHGYFEVNNDEIAKYTCADFLQKKGNDKEANRTPLFVRFSTTAGFRGSADTVRDARGFCFKLYTDEGNLDWVFFHPGVFTFWDPGKIVTSNHVTKKCPASGMSDPNMYFEFLNNNPEAFNSFVRIQSDDGTPKSYSDITIRSLNTYTLVKDDNNHSFVRVELRPLKTQTPFRVAEAVEMSGKDPDFHSRALWEQIAEGNAETAKYQEELDEVKEILKERISQRHRERLMAEKDKLEKAIENYDWPAWGVYAHIVKPEEVASFPVNIFDASKVFPEDKGTWVEMGKIVLNRNPRNYFAEVEQSAFSPANFVPGWDMSPDPILQARLFAYGDTQRHRLGPNADQLPVNRPKRVWCPTRRDGPHSTFNYEDIPHYLSHPTKTASAPGTNSFKSFVGNYWSRNAPIETERSINEWDTLEDQLKQPWEYYANDLNGAPPQEDQDATYAAKAREHRITYKQWAFVWNTALRISTVREDLRHATYDKFRVMDNKWNKNRTAKQNLGDLIHDVTEELASKNKKKSTATGIKTRAPAPEVAPSLTTVGNAYDSVSNGNNSAGYGQRR